MKLRGSYFQENLDAIVNETLTLGALTLGHKPEGCLAMAANEAQISDTATFRLEYATEVYALEGRTVWP
jgi:hypothetical protein